MKAVAKYVLCVWNSSKKKWTVEITLSDGSRRVIDYMRSRSRRASVKRIVDNVLDTEELIPAWDMRYAWKTINSQEDAE